MVAPNAPPLPSAAPLTTAAADRWRAAHRFRRLDSRWLALVPIAFVAFATAAHRPDLRPSVRLPDRLGSPQHVLNRIALLGFAAFTVVHYLR